MLYDMKKGRFLLTLGILLVSTLPAGPVYAEVCHDARGAVIPCPEKKRIPTNTAPPPTGLFTRRKGMAISLSMKAESCNRIRETVQTTRRIAVRMTMMMILRCQKSN